MPADGEPATDDPMSEHPTETEPFGPPQGPPVPLPITALTSHLARAALHPSPDAPSAAPAHASTFGVLPLPARAPLLPPACHEHLLSLFRLQHLV